MENEISQEETLNEKPVKRVKEKKNKQATVLKQLNNQSLYPLQERIGIYVIAVLSTIGLVLISYTGVMALVTGTTIGSETPVDVNVDEVYDALDNLDLDDLTVPEDDLDEPGQNAGNFEYVDPEEENEPEDDTETDESSDDDSDGETPTTGIINSNNVSFYREATRESDLLLLLHQDDVITLIDLDYNIYWAYIEIETTVFGGTTQRGFVERNFIDVE